MSKLTAKQRSGLRSSEFALPGRRFPIEDENHARAAISMAPKSFHAGNISEEQMRAVQAKARNKLRSLG